MTKILLTGGHASSTAYSVVSEIVAQHKKWQLFFVGGKSAFEGKRAKTVSHVTFSGSLVKYYSISTGRIQRRFTLWTIPALLKMPLGFMQSLYILMAIKPDIILSFGGYAAFPVVLGGWLLRIPIFLHEQTAVAGRANIVSAKFADKVLLARESSKPYFPKSTTVVVGNPISVGIRKIRPRTHLSKPPVILITGGSSGSVTINEAVEKILKKLLVDFKVVHQTGDLQFDHFNKLQANLVPKLRKHYRVYGVIKATDWPGVISKSDIIISRSGANIVSEIVFIKRPAILIPLKIAYLNEQEKNADYAAKYGIAVKILQDDLTDAKLLQTIDECLANWHKMVIRVQGKPSPDTYAASKVVDLLAQKLNG